MTHVLVTAPFPEHLMDKLRAVSRDLNIEQMNLPHGNKWPEDATTEAEVYYSLGSVPRLEQAPNLRWVQIHFAGIDSFTDQSIWKSDVLMTTASGVHATNIGQYVFAQMLMWANRTKQWLHYQSIPEWPSNRWEKFLPTELRGSTLGIVGYGSIGREIARLAKAFGMNVLATKRDAMRLEDSGFTLNGTGDPKGELPDRVYPTEATKSMVGECDFVVITAPLTEQTRYLFNEEMFKAMKSNSYLINIGRGPIVKEKDLVKALKKGWIAGAGLDVFEEEPLSTSSPLWALDNVIISPHCSGFTPEYDDRVTTLFAENLRRYLAGEPLINLVNRQFGY